MLTKSAYEHISIDEQGVAHIREANTKVVEIVLAKKAFEWEPEGFQSQFPHLSLGQIYSALAYYWDNKKQIDMEIEWRIARINHIQENMPPSKIASRLRGEGLID